MGAIAAEATFVPQHRGPQPLGGDGEVVRARGVDDARAAERQPLESPHLDHLCRYVRPGACTADSGRSRRNSWAIWIAMAPSPTAEATRLMARCRTSPTAKTPGRLVSRG